MESYCKSITKSLEYFGEYEFINRIREKQKYKMFGYVGRKDYSLNSLLDCYKRIPLTERKICDYGMRLFSVSNMANSIGDNRFSIEVDKALFDDAIKLGYKYFNAFFEVRNVPKDLVYWRMNAIDSLYNNIELVDTDSELLALYNLTNAWISPRIEQDRQYNRMDTLKEYNYKVIKRVSNPDIKQKLVSKGMYGTKDCDQDFILSGKKDDLEEISIIRTDGYSDKVENMILMHVEKRDLGLHKLIADAGKIIATDFLDRYANNCVVKCILSESEYGYVYTGISEILEQYYLLISDESWKILFEDIVKRFAEKDYDQIASLWGDFTIFSIYYLLKKDKGKISDLFDCLCTAHEKLSSANGRVVIGKEVLAYENGVESLYDMVKYQRIV
jgi:hypothetical protein